MKLPWRNFKASSRSIKTTQANIECVLDALNLESQLRIDRLDPSSVEIGLGDLSYIIYSVNSEYNLGTLRTFVRCLTEQNECIKNMLLPRKTVLFQKL